MNVVLSGGSRDFLMWGEQYGSYGSGRRNIVMRNNTSLSGAVRKIRQAAGEVSNNGTLIFNLGHGGSSGIGSGMVDLAPRRHFRISSNILSNPRGRQEQRVKDAYDEVSQIMRDSAVGEAVFLSCNVGNAMDFVQRIANDWNVHVKGYQQRVAAQIVNLGGRTGRISVLYLEDAPPRNERQMLRASHELPTAGLGRAFTAEPGRRTRRVPGRVRRVPE